MLPLLYNIYDCVLCFISSSGLSLLVLTTPECRMRSNICYMQMKQLSKLLDEDPAVMERRTNLAKRLELYRSAQAEIDAVAWSK